jgi:hypothetical protein
MHPHPQNAHMGSVLIKAQKNDSRFNVGLDARNDFVQVTDEN